MVDEHKRILKLIDEKIKKLEDEKIKDSENELNKLNALYRLISNQYNTFFRCVDMNIALKILEDAGVEQEDKIESYKRLIKEENKDSKTYVLMNAADDEKENLNKGEER